MWLCTTEDAYIRYPVDGNDYTVFKCYKRTRPEMQFPNASRDLFIAEPSICMFAFYRLFVLLIRSDPAKSIIVNFAIFSFYYVAMFYLVINSYIIAWEREEVLFLSVAPVIRFYAPNIINSMISSFFDIYTCAKFVIVVPQIGSSQISIGFLLFISNKSLICSL